jgi:hypothetical protein
MKIYKLTERINPRYVFEKAIYNGLKKIATITECKMSHIGQWEVILYPASLGYWFPSEKSAKEFLRKSEESYLNSLGSSITVVWKEV